CAEGALRCDGNLVEKCAGGSWSEIAQCLGGCSGGACSGGSCVPGFALAAAQPAPLPADRVSTVLVVSGPMLDASGAPLPDGTAVNLAATGGAQIVSPSAQARTLQGRVDFAVRAPPSAATSTVSATVAGAATCAAVVQLPFAAPAGSAYASEDFSTDLSRDFAQTTAQWQVGQVVAATSEFGDGL